MTHRPAPEGWDPEAPLSFVDGVAAAVATAQEVGVTAWSLSLPATPVATGNAAGFSVVDPGGNWVRVFSTSDAADDSTDEPASHLARALENAVVLGDSKGDTRQAARILDGALDRHRESAPVPDLVEALVYGAELAMRLGNRTRAGVLLAQVAGVDLTGEQRGRRSEALANAADLDRARDCGG